MKTFDRFCEDARDLCFDACMTDAKIILDFGTVQIVLDRKNKYPDTALRKGLIYAHLCLASAFTAYFCEKGEAACGKEVKI